MIVIPKYMKSDIESLKWKQEAVEFGNPPRLRAVSRQLGLSHNDMERCVWNKTHRSYMIWYWKEVSYKWNILNRSIKHNSLWNLSFFFNKLIIFWLQLPAYHVRKIFSQILNLGENINMQSLCWIQRDLIKLKRFSHFNLT